MSIEPIRLSSWITAIMTHLETSEPSAHARLVAVVGARRARITLDGDTVVVSVVRGRLTVLPGDTEPVDGEGGSSRAAVLALLDGRLETSIALREGLVYARGSVESVGRIFHAIEIVLDVSARSPALRSLAAQYRAVAPPGSPVSGGRSSPVGRELELLDRLGLLGS
ncbi:MAG: hypothetical protein ACR2JK_13865 [Geodermatophilaceae bacterium]